MISSAKAVNEFLNYNPNILIVERADAPYLMDSIQGLVIKARAKDLFSRQYSFIYELKK